MLSLAPKTLLILCSLGAIYQPVAHAQAHAQGRPGSQYAGTGQAPIQPPPAQGRPGAQDVYSCSKDNVVKYTTPNGVTFELKCDHGTKAKPLDSTIALSHKACADYCSELPNCQSCDWNANTRTFPLPGTHTWFLLEERKPRPDPEPRTPPRCPTPKLAISETTNTRFTVDGKYPAISDDGKTFLTPQGTYFQVKCGVENPAATGLSGSRPLDDFAECMTACADLAECKSVTFSESNWQCNFFDTGVEAFAVDATKKKASAVIINPPSYEKPDDITFLYSTECPEADRQIWESPNGVVSV
ncbi:hypothetical protein ACMFMG_003672 [Clarireedia jacksonii]